MSVPSSAVGVAVIGAGVISDQYLRNLTSFPDLKVHVVADVLTDRAAAKAEQWGVAGSGGVDAALTHPDVDIVVNITVPAAHVAVSKAILESGKHVWTEKPLGVDREGGRELIEAAARLGLRVGSAPDTFLGEGMQSTQRLIERGDIGQPLSAITMMQDPGPESWHENPDFIYATGAGPLFDRGPYYYTMLAQMFGSFSRVGAVGTKAVARRTVLAGPRTGQSFPVEVPTNVQVIASFENGISAQSTYSYESPFKRFGFVEISGTEAAIRVPDPNHFTGGIQISKYRSEEWTSLPARPFTAERGTGVLEMARAIRAGQPHRASAELAYHVLDAMIASMESIESGEMVRVDSAAPVVAPLPEDWDPYESTL